MHKSIDELKDAFKRIKENGWVKSLYKGNNGVGLTFESLLGIDRNELEIPDYNGIELKTKRYSSKSYIILFSSKPEGRFYHEAQRIKDTYGYPHKIYKECKVLNNSVYCNKKSKIGMNYYFKLDIDREDQRIYLVIFDTKNNQLERSVYWDFEVLREKLYRKLKYVALIKAYSKIDEDSNFEFFKYNSLKIYKLINFEKFLEALEKGKIRLNFKLNIKTKGENLGKIHDHGTSFDILEENFEFLFERIE